MTTSTTPRLDPGASGHCADRRAFAVDVQLHRAGLWGFASYCLISLLLCVLGFDPGAVLPMIVVFGMAIGWGRDDDRARLVALAGMGISRGARIRARARLLGVMGLAAVLVGTLDSGITALAHPSPDALSTVILGSLVQLGAGIATAAAIGRDVLVRTPGWSLFVLSILVLFLAMVGVTMFGLIGIVAGPADEPLRVAVLAPVFTIVDGALLFLLRSNVRRWVREVSSPTEQPGPPPGLRRGKER